MVWFQRWFEKISAAVRSESHAVQEAVKQQVDSIRVDREAAKHKENEAAGIIAGAINDASKATSSYEKPQRNKEFWLQVGIAVLTLLTAVGALAAAFANFGALTEIKHQTRISCLNTQAAQETIEQIERSALDSHAVAVATVQQEVIGIETQRAVMRFSTRLPEAGEILTSRDRGTFLGIPYSIKNEGKSTAVNYRLTFRAVLLHEGDKLVISYPANLILTMKGTFAAGVEDPEPQRIGSQFRPLVKMVPVEDIEGKLVSYNSKAADDFRTGHAEVMVFGNMQYRDNWGKYSASFCDPQSVVPAGAGKGAPTPEEIKCINYNHEENELLVKPTPLDSLPAKTFDPPPINCPTE